MSAHTAPPRVGLVEQSFAQPRALVRRRVGRQPFADQAMGAIDRHMVLIAEGRNGDADRRLGSVFAGLRLGALDRPARVAVLVAQFGGLLFPILRHAAFLDRLILLARVALFGRGDQAGVDNLAGHGDVAGSPKRAVETVEQRLDHAGPGQLFAKQPDRAGVGDTAG